VIAIALAIAKGFELDQKLLSIITSTNEFESYQEVLEPLLAKAQQTVQNTSGEYIAGIGVIILFWSVVSLLGQIENSFNHIWQISSSRPWYRKFTDYLTIMLITPVFLILSSSITVFITTDLADYMSEAPILSSMKWIITLLIRFAPYLLTWIVLTLLFIVMPNTRVKFGPALVSAVIAGTILKVLQWLYLDLQFGITKLNAIYGGLAAVPLFIIFLQTCWVIILLGAELSFANQNISRYEFESEALNISHFTKKALVLMVMHMIIRKFYTGDRPVSAETIGKLLKIPLRLANDILNDLGNAGLVSVIHENEQKERLYQPALDINQLTVAYVLSRLDRKGLDSRMIIRNKEYDKVVLMLEKFDRMIAKSGSNILIKEL
jgi:membrane protein